jgi:ATP-dependent protease Clp ATPase subunit
MEEIMIGLMYDLPDHDHSGAEYVIDERAVNQPRRLADLRVKRKESA